MEPSDFADQAPGKLVKGLEGYWAFVPDPLPPQLQMNTTTIKKLSAADFALGELQGVGQMLPNPQLLIDPFLRREAMLSSKAEWKERSPV